MSTDANKTYRMKLGPVVSSILDTMEEPTPAALDTKLQELLNLRENIVHYERGKADGGVNTELLHQRLDRLESAFVGAGELVNSLADLVDHRTRELAKLCLHISGLVGNSLTEEGEERDHLHRRFNDIFNDLEKQMGALSEKVLKRKGEYSQELDQLKTRVEDQQLTDREKKAVPNKGIER